MRVSVSLISFILWRTTTVRTSTSCFYTSLVNVSVERDISSIYEAPTGRRISIRFTRVRRNGERERERGTYTIMSVRTLATLSTFLATTMLIPRKTQQYHNNNLLYNIYDNIYFNIIYASNFQKYFEVSEVITKYSRLYKFT